MKKKRVSLLLQKRNAEVCRKGRLISRGEVSVTLPAELYPFKPLAFPPPLLIRKLKPLPFSLQYFNSPVLVSLNSIATLPVELYPYKPFTFPLPLLKRKVQPFTFSLHCINSPVLVNLNFIATLPVELFFSPYGASRL